MNDDQNEAIEVKDLQKEELDDPTEDPEDLTQTKAEIKEN